MSLQIEAIVQRLQRLPVGEARRELSQFLRGAHELQGAERAERLNLNAHLVTAIRQAKIPIWGVEG